MRSLIIFLFLIFNFSNSYAHHKIYSPKVEEGRQSLEWRGHFGFDDRNIYNKGHHHVFETEYSWTDFWQSELELHVSDKSETPLDWEKTEFQNQVQIFDLQNFSGAIYFSYNFVSEGDEADEIEYKYLNEFYNDYIGFISNFIFEKQVGSGATGSTEFGISNYLVLKDFLPHQFYFGILGFSELGEVSNFNVFGKQKHQYGFQFEREFLFNDLEFEIALGYLHGLTDETANHSMIWNFELEF